MKKFFAHLLLIVSALAAGLVATPFQSIASWVPSLQPILDQIAPLTLYIKGGLGGVMILGSLIFLFVVFYEVKNYGQANGVTAMAAFLPPLMFGFGALLYTFPLAFQMTWEAGFNLFRRLPIVAIPLALVNIIILGHYFAKQFRIRKNCTRVLLYFVAIQIALVGGFVSYLLYYYRWPNTTITINLSFYAFIAPLFLVLYFIYAIIAAARKGKVSAEEVSLEPEVKEIKQHSKEIKKAKEEKVQKQEKHVEEKKLTKSEQKQLAKQQQVQQKDGKKTLIVSKQQTIISSEHDVDPTNLLYEDVNIDPEFNKTNNLDKQISTIDYYIEKPKLTKPLDPQFDELVQYIRDLPSVVTKLADEKITFYVDRKPFMVLMNFGNYYRMVFRADLEKGIRLIIKYPTISKNKAAKEDLWFKANNYGDLPREIVFDIAKSAYDNVNL